MATTRPPEIMGTITFERPPLVEVSFGVRFSPLKALRTSHYGLLWSLFKEEFSDTEDKPPVLGDPSDQQTAAEWFPMPRVWFVEPGQGSILQFQPNRFYFNWRRTPPDAPYPRFAQLAPRFMRYLATLTSFVQEQKLGELEIQWTELAYINHMYEGGGWKDFTEINKVFPDLCWGSRNPRLTDIQGVAWKAVFDVADIRVSGEVKTARETAAEDGKRLFSFDLRASSTHAGLSISDIDLWFRTANEVVVRSFADLTSEGMQKEVWKRGGA